MSSFWRRTSLAQHSLSEFSAAETTDLTFSSSTREMIIILGGITICEKVVGTGAKHPRLVQLLLPYQGNPDLTREGSRACFHFPGYSRRCERRSRGRRGRDR